MFRSVDWLENRKTTVNSQEIHISLFFYFLAYSAQQVHSYPSGKPQKMATKMAKAKNFLESHLYKPFYNNFMVMSHFTLKISIFGNCKLQLPFLLPSMPGNSLHLCFSPSASAFTSVHNEQEMWSVSVSGVLG